MITIISPTPALLYPAYCSFWGTAANWSFIGGTVGKVSSYLIELKYLYFLYPPLKRCILLLTCFFQWNHGFESHLSFFSLDRFFFKMALHSAAPMSVRCDEVWVPSLSCSGFRMHFWQPQVFLLFCKNSKLLFLQILFLHHSLHSLLEVTVEIWL